MAEFVEPQILPVAVELVLFDELCVGSDGGDFSLMEEHDFVRAAEGGESIGKIDDRPVLLDSLVGIVQEVLGGVVEFFGRFLDDHQGGVAEAGTGETQAEGLSVVEILAMFADHGFIAVGEKADEVVGVAHFGRFDDLGEGEILVSHGEVLADGSGEEGFLRPDAGDFGAEGIECGSGEILSVDFHLA